MNTDFEQWWEKHRQFCRAGGGEYEKTFAFRAWEAAIMAEREACKADCRKIGAQYPTDIWLENGDSLDCKSARTARLTAENCEREIDKRSNDQAKGPATAARSADGDGPA